LHLQDSYALCRIFKKTIQIPKTKEKEESGNLEKDSVSALDEQLLGDDTSGFENFQGREAEDENFIHEYSKFPSDTSSSDLTQGTPAETGIQDDLQAPFASDEANSAGNLYSLGVDCPSTLFQVKQ
jgi:hypothetical protein